MLKNDYLLAKIGVDTAENKPRKEWCVVPRILSLLDRDVAELLEVERAMNSEIKRRVEAHRTLEWMPEPLFSLDGSFSAVLTPIFASK